MSFPLFSRNGLIPSSRRASSRKLTRPHPPACSSLITCASLPCPVRQAPLSCTSTPPNLLSSLLLAATVGNGSVWKEGLGGIVRGREVAGEVTMRLRLFGVPPNTLCLHGMKAQSRVRICIGTAPFVRWFHKSVVYLIAKSKLILTEYAFDDVVQRESNWSSRIAAG